MASNRCSICQNRGDNSICQRCQASFCVKHFNEHHRERQPSLRYSLRPLRRCRGSFLKWTSPVKLVDETPQEQQRINRLHQSFELSRSNKSIVKNDSNQLTYLDKTQERGSKGHFHIHPNTKWAQNGITVAGDLPGGNGLNQLSYPRSLYVDDHQTLLIADSNNNRIVEWKAEATSGDVMAGRNGKGSGNEWLNQPSDVLVDKRTDSLIICDTGNRRVMRWPRRGGTTGQTIISNVHSYGLNLGYDGFLYVSDYLKHEVRRWQIGETQGILVAGGNGCGNRVDQLNYPTNIFVDRDHSVYVSDFKNDRVMKWMKDAKEGIIVAGGQGQGRALTQLTHPRGLFVDQSGSVYVVDRDNHRITRWPKGATQGSVIVGGNGEGRQANQLNYPTVLSFDLDGNLYVADIKNNRVQRFSIDAD